MIARAQADVRRLPDSAAAEKASALSNLAAAYLTRADPVDRVAALDATERALQLHPRCIEALHNRALSLRKLFLPDQERRAWREYLAVETDPGWTGEIRAALAALSTGPGETWDQAQQQLRQAVADGDAAAVTDLVDRFRQEARTLAEEDLLAEWAAEPTEARLAVVREIGRSLAQLSGERLLADTVAGIDAAGSKEPLVRGLLAFREGLLLFRDRRFALAEAPLERSRTALLQAKSPFAAWPSYLLIRCAYQRRNAPSLDRQFQDFWEQVKIKPYPVIAARARWTLGTSQLERGRPAEALASYQWALARFQKTGETLHEAAVHSLVAGAFDQLGDARSSWQHHLLALKGFATQNPNRVRLELIEAAFAALDAGFPRAAVRLQSAAVEIARQGSDPEVLTNTLLNRAQILERAGFPGSEVDLAAARPLCARIPDPSVRRSLEDDLLLTEGAHFSTRDPARALGFLDTAVERHADRRLLLPSILALRAEARKALGRIPEAEADLRRAVAILEEERGTVPEPEQRASFLSRVDAVYDALVLLLAERGQEEDALDVSERRRGRVLLDWIHTLPADLASARLSTPAAVQPVRTLQPQLPSGTALLVYEPLADRLLIWVVRRETVDLQSVAIPAAEVTRQVRALTGAVESSAKRVQEAAGRLHQTLLSPVSRLLRPADTLVFLPRGPVEAVPFGLLFDARTGRYLIESYAFAVSPSLNAFASLQPRRGTDFSRASVLAITDPAFDRSLFPLLDRLPGAQTEGKALRSLYGSQVEWISADDATSKTFLEGLRRARLLHFGGHAAANPTHPLLSGLLLSPRPESGDSGVLYARKLLGPRDSVTELAVLSACGSAAGAAQPGEGVAGLVWPLLARGVPRVIATLWNVRDSEAAALTSAFYRHLHAGLSPLQALRRAQLEIFTANRKSFGWAAFQLYGGEG